MNTYEIYDMNGQLIKTIKADRISLKNGNCFLAVEISDTCSQELVATISINHTVVKV